MPALSWPAPKNRPPVVRYIARSTMIGLSAGGRDDGGDLDVLEAGLERGRGCWCACWRRSSSVRTMGAAGGGSRYVTVNSSSAAAFGILNQVIELEVADRGALGQVPGRGRGRRCWSRHGCRSRGRPTSSSGRRRAARSERTTVENSARDQRGERRVGRTELADVDVARGCAGIVEAVRQHRRSCPSTGSRSRPSPASSPLLSSANRVSKNPLIVAPSAK